MRLFPGVLLTVGVSAQQQVYKGIPQYGPTRGDRCLSRRDDEAGKYTMQNSDQSYNQIEEECRNKQGKMLTSI